MATLLQDAFTEGTNGVSLDAHTMLVGAGWTEGQGNWDIQSNRANLAADAGDGQNVASADAGDADVTISLDVIAAGSGDIESSILLNFVDTSNYWFFGPSTFDGGEVLYKRVAGTFTKVVDNNSGAPTNSTTYSLKTTTRGDGVALYKNGSMIAYYESASRPLKTATKHGLRQFRSGASGDQGSRFDNLSITSPEPIVFPPHLLTYAKVGGAHSMVDAFSTRFAIVNDDFSSNTIANYTQTNVSGTTTATISGGAITLTNAAAGNALLTANVSPGVAPYMWASVRVTSLSDAANVTPYVGFRSGATDYVWNYIFNSQSGIDSKNNNVAGGGGGAPTGSFTPPYTMYCVLSYPEIWTWIDSGSGPVAIQKSTIDQTVDLRLITKFSTSWKPIFGADRATAGSSATFDNFRCGYIGGAPGLRDFKPITYADGKPYQVGSLQYFTATCATSNSFDGNHWCVLSVDVDTGAATIVSHLFFRVAHTDRGNPLATKTKCTAQYGGQIVLDPTGVSWFSFGNGWGDETLSTGINIYFSSTTANILQDGAVVVLDSYKLPIPTTKSVYDCTWRWDSGWKMACAETNAATGWTNYYTTYFEGATPDTMSRIRQDSTNATEAEQQNWMKIGDTWYINSGGTGGPHYWNADLTSYLGTLLTGLDLSGTNTSYSNYGSGYCVTPINRGGQTQYMVLLFSNDTTLSASATKGYLWVEQSVQVRDGNEFTDVGFTLSPSTIPANHSGTLRVNIIGTGTNFGPSTVFNLAAGLNKVGQNVSSTTSAYVDVTTTATTGSLAITESVTGTATANVIVAVATISVTPTTALLNTTPTLTITTTNMVLTQEIAASLLSISGGSGASLGTPTILGDNSAQVDLTGGAGTGTLTITLNPVSGGVSDTVAVGAATAYYASGPTRGAVNIAKTYTLYANGTTTATVTGHTTGTGSFASTVALNGTSPVTLSYTPTTFNDSPHTLSFTDDGGLTDPGNIVLTVTEFPDKANVAPLLAIGVI